MNQHAAPQTLWKLFASMLYISSFTFGGGFVIVTLMQKRFVNELHWLDEDEMLDLTALAQSAPGPIALNAAILVGWRVGGLGGMAAASLGTVLPPLIILSVISFFYAVFAANPLVALALKGMQAGVAAVILDVVCSLGGKVLRQRKPVYIAMMAGAFVATAVLEVNVIAILLACALLGVLLALCHRWGKGGSV